MSAAGWAVPWRVAFWRAAIGSWLALTVCACGGTASTPAAPEPPSSPPSEVTISATATGFKPKDSVLAVGGHATFQNIDDRDFDFIVFNTPLIDQVPESDVERYSLCDPDGRTLGAFVRAAGNHIKKTGLIIFSLCSNSAYEMMDGVGLKFRVIALELGASGFWRAIVGAQR